MFAAMAILSLCRPAFALSTGDRGVKEGDPAPMFSGLTVDDRTIDFAQLKGRKIVLLDFWSIYCASCIDGMPRLIEINNEFSEKGLQVIGVNLDSFGARRVARFMRGT